MRAVERGTNLLWWLRLMVFLIKFPLGPNRHTTLSNRQSLTANHTILFLLVQQTLTPLLSIILIPALSAGLPVLPTSAPQGLSNIIQHNGVLYFVVVKTPLFSRFQYSGTACQIHRKTWKITEPIGSSSPKGHYKILVQLHKGMFSRNQYIM